MLLPVAGGPPRSERSHRLLDETDVRLLTECLEPADIVLFHGPAARKNVVMRCQDEYGFAAPASAISHVAMYVGHELICHAIPATTERQGGVVIEKIERGLAGRAVTVVRYEGFNVIDCVRPKMLVVQRVLLCAGQPYDYLAVARLAVGVGRLLMRHRADPMLRDPFVAFFARRPQAFPADETRGFLCSDLIYDCFSTALRENNPLDAPHLMRSPNRLPAEFYLNEALLTLDWGDGDPALSRFSAQPLA